MKILLTKSEYRTLFDMIYMAEWMLTAYDVQPDPDKERYAHLAQKIYSHAKEAGCESLIHSSSADNEYHPSREYEDKGGVHDLIEDYDNDVFWDELVERMTERDVYAALDETQRLKVSAEAYFQLAEPISERYGREFDAHGIERLTLATSPAAKARGEDK